MEGFLCFFYSPEMGKEGLFCIAPFSVKIFMPSASFDEAKYSRKSNIYAVDIDININ